MAVHRTTINLDRELAREAQEALGAPTVTAAIHQALRDSVRRRRLEGLRDWDFDGFGAAELDEMRRPRSF